MKLEEAERLIRYPSLAGYRVAFEERKNGMLESGYFPDPPTHTEHTHYSGEAPFAELQKAYDMARQFAESAPPNFVNIHVVHDRSYMPVFSDEETFRRYPKEIKP